MYNLTVDTAHTFFVGDGQWLVHNACRKITPGGYGNSILVPPNSLGGVLATEAKNLLSLVKGQTDDLTIAIGQFRGNRITVINGGAPIGIENILGAKRALGFQHAEKFLFNKYGKALDAIGVSHWKGPCRNKCYPMFEKANYWDVFFDDKFVK